MRGPDKCKVVNSVRVVSPVSTKHRLSRSFSEPIVVIFAAHTKREMPFCKETICEECLVHFQLEGNHKCFLIYFHTNHVRKLYSPGLISGYTVRLPIYPQNRRPDSFWLKVPFSDFIYLTEIFSFQHLSHRVNV